MSNQKKKTLEELQDEFNSLTRKRYQMLMDLDAVTKELVGLAEKVYENSPEYVKVTCPSCNGKTIVEGEEGKKVKCPSCYPRGFLWMQRFKEMEKKVEKQLNDN